MSFWVEHSLEYFLGRDTFDLNYQSPYSFYSNPIQFLCAYISISYGFNLFFYYPYSNLCYYKNLFEVVEIYSLVNDLMKDFMDRMRL